MRVRGDSPLSSDESPVMIFAPSEGAQHRLKRNGGTGHQYASLDELDSFEGTEELITVGVEYVCSAGNTVVLNYKLRSSTMAVLAARLNGKCREIVRTYSRWPTYKRTPSRSVHLANSCDQQFRALYWVISLVFLQQKMV